MLPTPRTFSHIGLSVPDVDAAVKFYTGVLGFYTIMEPTEIKEDDSPIGRMCTDVFGPGWKRLRIAHLAICTSSSSALDSECPESNRCSSAPLQTPPGIRSRLQPSQ